MQPMGCISVESTTDFFRGGHKRMTIKARERQNAALATTLGLAAAAWIVTVRQMHGMDMGVATQLGSFAFFVALWVAMMAAMMLPGAVQAVSRRVEASSGVRVA